MKIQEIFLSNTIKTQLIIFTDTLFNIQLHTLHPKEEQSIKIGENLNLINRLYFKSFTIKQNNI